MQNNNICRFVPPHKSDDVINAVNFVYETEPQKFIGFRNSAVYIITLVFEGSGVLNVSSRNTPIEQGDLFFIFPATPYTIIPEADLKYMYISYIGVRAVRIMEKLGINKNTPVYKNYNTLHDFWQNSLGMVSKLNVDMLSESVLLYTFSELANRLLTDTERSHETYNSFSQIKKYIDDNFNDTHLSLEKISKNFSYNRKYLSTMFKKQMNTCFSNYLNTLRIQNAFILIEEGLSSIKDISYLCGYSDPAYFTKVFKKKMGYPPSEHMKIMK